MKKGIHPENYRLVAFKDMSNGVTTLTKSTVATNIRSLNWKSLTVLIRSIQEK